MKKKYLLILLLCSSFSFSQKKFGAFTGLNYIFLTKGNYEGLMSEHSISFHIGILYQIDINEKISFRPKLMFSQQGDRKKTAENSIFNLTNLDYKLNYINVPLDFKFGNKFYLLTGPQIGYLINTKKMSADYGNIKSEIDLGLNLGCGININQYFIELGTYKGFSKLFEYEDEYDEKHFLTNTLFRLSLGYNF